MSLVGSLPTIRFYTAADPYYYTVDNRPLQDLQSADVAIATRVDQIVPPGGTTNQVLSKVDGTDYNTTWAAAPHSIPTGGTTRQMLGKVDGTDYNVTWDSIHEVPAGGTTNQVLSKVDGTDYNTIWTTNLSYLQGGLRIAYKNATDVHIIAVGHGYLTINGVVSKVTTADQVLTGSSLLTSSIYDFFATNSSGNVVINATKRTGYTISYNSTDNMYYKSTDADSMWVGAFLTDAAGVIMAPDQAYTYNGNSYTDNCAFRSYFNEQAIATQDDFHTSSNGVSMIVNPLYLPMPGDTLEVTYLTFVDSNGTNAFFDVKLRSGVTEATTIQPRGSWPSGYFKGDVNINGANFSVRWMVPTGAGATSGYLLPSDLTATFDQSSGTIVTAGLTLTTLICPYKTLSRP